MHKTKKTENIMLPGGKKTLFFEIIASFWEAKSDENHDFFATWKK